MIYCDVHTHREGSPAADELVIQDREINASFVLPETYCSVGIHPCSAPAQWEPYLESLASVIGSPVVVAVGEAGFDKRAAASLAQQEKLFIAQAELAEAIGKPLIIHCVKAWDELLQVRKQIKPHSPWIIHGFRGNDLLAGQLGKAGLLLSFGYYFNPEAVRSVWPKGILAETDERKVEIREVYERLSGALGLPVEVFARQVRENVGACFSI